MRRIYQKAHGVIIWLGASTEEIDCLFYWMRCLDHQMLTVECRYTITMWEAHWEFITRQSGRELDLWRIKIGLQYLLAREWFWRVWVIQEAALAKTAIIACGRNTVNSRTFVVMPALLKTSCNENVRSRLDIMPGLLRKRSWWAGTDSHDLSMLLQKFGRSKAKDPRDIIYALLGLSRDAFASDVLRPNYQISLQEAIQHTVAYLLIQAGHVKHYPDCNDMPIWNINQFLAALEDLPIRVHAWATDHGTTFLPNFSIL